VGEGERPLIERVERWLRSKQLLIILDNFEHLLAEAPLIVRLMSAGRGLKVLVTSRIELRVTGEHVVPVDPLELPALTKSIAPDVLWRNAAVQLFVERARAARSGVTFSGVDAEVVARICQRLDGLPLAIELAAAQAPQLSPRLMLARLETRLPLLTDGPRDAPARLRTMRNAITWSYDLLSPGEQAMFRRLSVFVGGFTMEMASALARGWRAEDGYPLAGGRISNRINSWSYFGKESPADVGGGWAVPELPALEINVEKSVWSLVAQNLVRPAAPVAGALRFEMLETIREYGLEQLGNEGETAAVRHAHAAAFLAFAEEAGTGFWWPEASVWSMLLEAELGNIREAHAWLVEQGPPANQLSLRLAETLWFFWQMRGHVREGRDWLEAALARPGGAPAARAAALNVAGMLAWVQNDDQRAEEALQESLPICRALDYRAGIGRSLFALALVAWRRGDYARVMTNTQEALGHFAAWNDQVGMSVCQIALAIAARGQGELARAAALLDDAERRCRSASFGWGIATAQYYSGEIARDQGEAARASVLLRSALALYVGVRDPWGTGACVAALASMAVERGELERAAILFGAAFAMCEEIGAFIPPTELATYQAAAAAVQTRMGDAAFAEALAVGQRLPVERVIAAALDEAVELSSVSPARQEPASDVIVATPLVEYGLKPAQLEVLRLLADGKSVKEIAFLRGRAQSTIYQHIVNIGEQLGVSGQNEIIAFAVRHGLV
jgi:non-specific serine/threonine protein kinase